jgi:formylglycine-generating enzyme required for sulfatase activity
MTLRSIALSWLPLLFACSTTDFREPAPDAAVCLPPSVPSCPPQDPIAPRRGEKGMVVVPRTCFQAGCDRVNQPCVEGDAPARFVEVGPFQIDETEVTRDDFARCIEQGGCKRTQQPAVLRQSASLPVGSVTYEEAEAFCKWLGKRLPSADEWELAARGTDGRLYPWGNQAPDCAHAVTRECNAGEPRPVGSLPQGASPYGALDMAGNVAELVAPSACELEHRGGVLLVSRRGGSHVEDVRSARASVSAASAQTATAPSIGFRCVRDGLPDGGP